MLIIFTVVVGIFCLKKFNFDFKGTELIVFWVLFTAFIYAPVFCANGFLLQENLFLPVIFLAVYYFLRMYKTQKYIKRYIFVIQIILSIIFLIIYVQYEKATCQGWCTGSLLINIIFEAIIAYMILINLINRIINKTNPLIAKMIIKIIAAISSCGATLFMFVQAFLSFEGADPWGLTFTFYALPLMIVGVLFLAVTIVLIKSVIKDKNSLGK